MQNMMQEHFEEIRRAIDENKEIEEHLERLPEVYEHEVVNLLVLQREWIVEV